MRTGNRRPFFGNDGIAAAAAVGGKFELYYAFVDGSFRRSHGLRRCLARRFRTRSCRSQCKRCYCVSFVGLELFGAIDVKVTIERLCRAIRLELGAFTDSFL